MEPKKRILVLGGGPSALACLYKLTSEPDWKERYEFTVLQQGWRAGGKGASGRNATEHQRIQEHGLHIMFGFYDNFFDMIEKVYGELKRPPGSALATWREAFHPEDLGVLEWEQGGRWIPIELTLPRNNAVPGQGGVMNSSRTWLEELVVGVFEIMFGPRAANELEHVMFPFDRDWEKSTGKPSEGTPDLITKAVITALPAIFELIRDVGIALEKLMPRVIALVEDLLRGIDALASVLVEGHPKLKLALETLEVLLALLRGTAADEVLSPGGLVKIDQMDFADWLVAHGLREEHRDCPFVQFIYFAAFSYVDGRAKRKRMGAGTAYMCILRIASGPKGATYFRMQAGMGDVIIAPIYQVLLARGVEFRFFHQVSHVAAENDRITRVRAWQQCAVKGGVGAYLPLVDVKGLPCWPDRPDGDQLVGGTPSNFEDLETYYASHGGQPTVDFEVGKDFDHVLLATPVGCLPFIAPELCARPRWKQMTDNVATVQTVAMQIWFDCDQAALGWPGPKPLLSDGPELYDTWSDMSQTMRFEDWPAGNPPKDASYFCGSQPGPYFCPPVDQDPDFVKRHTELARVAALEWIEEDMIKILPGIEDPKHPGKPDWSRFHDPKNRVGPARLEAQYIRSNADPSERCTLSLPGTNKHRMAADATGIENLTITGDWIDNGFYAACLEGAVMGGLLAARAISGVDFPILGERLYKDGLASTVQPPDDGDPNP
jgi:uncharacterized protein with NAD-binding domain and iron-sulfur cluster